MDAAPGNSHFGLMRMTVEPIGEKRIACPKCDSLALYRFGHVRSGLQRYLCRMCGREFIPGHERIFPQRRPACGTCGTGMHLFKKNGASTVFRCGRYPACRTYVRLETSPQAGSAEPPGIFPDEHGTDPHERNRTEAHAYG